MKIGAVIFATDYSIALTELAPALEARGFDSLFVPEHTHIPTSRRSPWRGGTVLPPEYSHTLDPFVAFATAASVTRTLRLGTGICLVTERDPIVTAKAVASLDLVSGGRFEFGIGAGWNAEEMEHHGTRFEPSWSWPKPVHKPHPPILLGGETVHTMRRVMDFCSGWLPRGAMLPDPADGMARLRAAADAAGRDPATVSATVFGAQAEDAYLGACRAAGIDRALLILPSEGREEVLPRVDRYAALIG